MCIIMRQTTITEQSFSEQHALRVLVARGRNRRDRLLAGAGGHAIERSPARRLQQASQRQEQRYSTVRRIAAGGIEGAGWNGRFTE